MILPLRLFVVNVKFVIDLLIKHANENKNDVEFVSGLPLITSKWKYSVSVFRRREAARTKRTEEFSFVS